MKEDSSPGHLIEVDPLLGRTPEMDLLLATARTQLEVSTFERLMDGTGPILDEDRFWTLARAHCVEPLVFLNLASRCGELRGGPALAAARERFERNARKNVALTRELFRILDLLEAGGVRGVPFKGPLLAEAAYGNLFARMFFDLDVAVRRADLVRARDLMLASGYCTPVTRTPREEAAYLRESHEYQLRSADGRFVLELHSRFSGRSWPMRLLPEDLWEHLVLVRLMGREVWSFPADALICVLAGHGAGHQWMRLDWIACLAEHVRANPELDWERAMELASVAGRLRATRLGLVLAHELLGAPVPRKVIEQATGDPTVRSLMVRTRRRLARGPGAGLTQGEWLTYEWACRERLWDRWAFLARHASETLTGTSRTGDAVVGGLFRRRLRFVLQSSIDWLTRKPPKN